MENILGIFWLITLEQFHLFNEPTNLENADILETVCLLEGLSDKLIPKIASTKSLKPLPSFAKSFSIPCFYFYRTKSSTQLYPENESTYVSFLPQSHNRNSIIQMNSTTILAIASARRMTGILQITANNNKYSHSCRKLSSTSVNRGFGSTTTKPLPNQHPNPFIPSTTSLN